MAESLFSASGHVTEIIIMSIIDMHAARYLVKHSQCLTYRRLYNGKRLTLLAAAFAVMQDQHQLCCTAAIGWHSSKVHLGQRVQGRERPTEDAPVWNSSVSTSAVVPA